MTDDTRCFICKPDDPRSRSLICEAHTRKGIAHLRAMMREGKIETPGPTCWVHEYDDNGNSIGENAI